MPQRERERERERERGIAYQKTINVTIMIKFWPLG
jgi:hypothetical protein